MSQRRLVRYALIPLGAILAFWWGGYFYFRNSSDWQDVQALVSRSSEIQAKVGEIKDISVRPFPFMYRFSGQQASATLSITVLGTTGEYSKTIDVQRQDGVWSLSP